MQSPLGAPKKAKPKESDLPGLGALTDLSSTSLSASEKIEKEANIAAAVNYLLTAPLAPKQQIEHLLLRGLTQAEVEQAIARAHDPALAEVERAQKEVAFAQAAKKAPKTGGNVGQGTTTWQGWQQSAKGTQARNFDKATHGK